MKNIKLSLWVLLLGLTGLWVFSNSDLLQPLTFFGVRRVLLQYTGVIAIAAMGVAMVLATRPRWPESFFGGLDKTYRLHKWLGIVGLVFAVAHYFAANVPKWLVRGGLLERPQRGPQVDPETLGAIQRFFVEQRHTAETLGTIAFFVAVLFIALALIKRFPYRLFAKTHKVLAVVYLALAFHSVVLMRFDSWTQPVGIATGVIIAAGVVSAFLVLFGMVGAGRQAQGTIETLDYYPALKVLATNILLEEAWQGHQAGQFAFVTYHRKEGPHPYTIASAWDPKDRRILFITKALGDYTDFLPDRLKVGDKVKVEGPYGCFTFDDGHRRQIWVGGGIGITPFIARMKQLAADGHDQRIDLFHTTQVYEKEPIERVAADADAAGVQLHVMVDDRDGRLDGAKLRQAMPDWRSASVWFCGPKGFGEALRKDLVTHGLSPRDFHQELFNIR